MGDIVTLIINKHEPTEDEIKNWYATVPGFIQGATSTDDKPTKLYDYQEEFMLIPDIYATRFRSCNKSRQTGYSFSFAAEGLAKSHLKTSHSSIYVSYNLDDATEKIRFAKLLYETLPLAWQKKLVVDNKTQLVFRDSQGRESRLISNPCRPPRGKGKSDVYLDELAFYINPQQIYTAAVPIITRGGGILTIASTPLGKKGTFYDIHEGKTKYKRYVRQDVPWWFCPDFCINVDSARRNASAMTTKERVYLYGNEIVQMIYESMDEDSFQQEYELLFIDESTAYISYDLIVPCTKDEDELTCFYDTHDFLHWLAKGNLRGQLWAGYDVGRRKDLSELFVLEEIERRMHVRLMHTIEKEKFQAQKDRLRLLLTQSPTRRLCMDENGIGMNLAEDLADEFRHRVEPVSLTNASKGVMAVDVKILFEDKNIWIPRHRNLMQQVHSIKKTVTAAGNIRFDPGNDTTTAEGEKHHADKFWGLALAVHAGSTPIEEDQFKASAGSLAVIRGLRFGGYRT